MAGSSTGANRPFWMHQVVEYIIGAAFISTAINSPTPQVPILLGGLILVNSAVAIGPAGAFRLVHRQVHRILDLVVLALILVAAVQPVFEINNGTRVVMIGLGLVMAFVWWNSDFSTREQRRTRRGRAARPDAEAVGRTAGRSAAGTYLAAKRLKKAMVDDRRSADPTDGEPAGDS